MLWLLSLLKDFHVDVLEPVELRSDNRSALSLSRNPVFHDRTKHVEMDVHFIWEKVAAGITEPIYVHTSQQLADLFTNTLAGPQFYYLTDKLSITDIRSPHTHLERGVSGDY